MTRLRIINPIVSAVELMSGETIVMDGNPVVDQALKLFMTGFKSRMILKGSREWPGLGGLSLEFKEGELRAFLRAFRERHPLYDKWAHSVHRMSYKEGFVTNPYGRRAYCFRDDRAQQFLVFSTAQDALKELLMQVPGRIKHIEFGSAIVDGTPSAPLKCALPFSAED